MIDIASTSGFVQARKSDSLKPKTTPPKEEEDETSSGKSEEESDQEPPKKKKKIYSTLDEQNLSDVNQRAVKNSVIKCFEICYDTLWKQIKKYLQDENGKAELRNSPIPIFRAAFEDLLFNKDVHKRLVQYNKIRNDAAHDYSIEKAMAALDKVGEFVQDTEEIYEVMVKGE